MISKAFGKSGAYYVRNSFSQGDGKYAYAKYSSLNAFLERTELPVYVSLSDMNDDLLGEDKKFYGKHLTVTIPKLGRSREIYVDNDGWMKDKVESKSRRYYTWTSYKKSLEEAYGKLEIKTHEGSAHDVL